MGLSTTEWNVGRSLARAAQNRTIGPLATVAILTASMYLAANRRRNTASILKESGLLLGTRPSTAEVREAAAVIKLVTQAAFARPTATSALPMQIEKSKWLRDVAAVAIRHIDLYRSKGSVDSFIAVMAPRRMYRAKQKKDYERGEKHG